MALPTKLRAFLASRDMRLHHYLWHAVREGWETFHSDIKDERERKLRRTETQKQISDRGWAPNGRPSYNENGLVIHDNGSGEDFLFMHRQMIDVANQFIREQCVFAEELTPWESIPGPANGEFPVPPAWEIPSNRSVEMLIRNVKTDIYFYTVIREWTRQYTDPTWLLGRSLGELGSRLEYTIHNMMHVRWCERPWDPDTGTYRSFYGRPDADLDEKWDDPRYDYLNDTYSSHIHPTFWKLHGWIDRQIDAWYKVNSKKVKTRELGGVTWFEPGELVSEEIPWVGAHGFHTFEVAREIAHGEHGSGHEHEEHSHEGEQQEPSDPGHHHGPQPEPDHLKTMEEVARILNKLEVFPKFYVDQFTS